MEEQPASEQMEEGNNGEQDQLMANDEVDLQISCEEMLKRIIQRYENEDKAFAQFDKDGDGRVSFQEFIDEMQTNFIPENGEFVISELFKRMDKDHDGFISRKEWEEELSLISNALSSMQQPPNAEEFPIGNDKDISGIERQNLSKQLDSNKRDDLMNMFQATPQRDQGNQEGRQLNQGDEVVTVSQQYPDVLKQAKNCKNLEDMANQLNSSKIQVGQKGQAHWDQKLFEAFTQKRLSGDVQYSPGKSMDLEIQSKPLLYKTTKVVQQYMTPRKDEAQAQENPANQGSMEENEQIDRHFNMVIDNARPNDEEPAANKDQDQKGDQPKEPRQPAPSYLTNALGNNALSNSGSKQLSYLERANPSFLEQRANPFSYLLQSKAPTLNQNLLADPQQQQQQQIQGYHTQSRSLFGPALSLMKDRRAVPNLQLAPANSSIKF